MPHLTAILMSRGAGARRAVKWSALAFAASLPDLAVRAQDFAYPLFVVVLWIILRDLERPRSAVALAAAVGCLVLWANVHGSVLLGCALLGAYCVWQVVRFRAGRRAGIYVTAAIATAIAPLVTPYGIDTTTYYRSILDNSAIQGFGSEWQPAYAIPLASVGFAAVLAVAVGVIGVGWRRGVRPHPFLLLATAVLCVAGLDALRWQAWGAVMCTIVATDVLNRTQQSDRGSRPRASWIVAAAALCTVSVGFLLMRSATRFESPAPESAMARAASYAVGHPGSQVLGDDLSSSALLWLHPELKGRVVFDNRLELFDQVDLRAWGDFIRGRSPQWEKLARRFDVVVGGSNNTDLREKLVASGRWRVLVADGAGVAAVQK